MRKTPQIIAVLFVLAFGILAQAGVLTLSRGITSSGGSSSGGFSDGQAITISGSGFGTFSGTRMSIEDDIEAASAGTHVVQIAALVSGGFVDATEASTGRWHDVSTSSPLVGTKVMLAQSSGGDGRFGMGWNTGGDIARTFVRDYVHISSTDLTPVGQWKMIRFTNSNCITDDDPSNHNLFNWFNSSFDVFQSNEGPGCGLGATNIDGSSGDYGTVMDVWYEREIEVVFGSQGVADGIVQTRLRRVSDWVEVSNISHTNHMHFDSDNTNRPRHIMYHDYQGNGLADVTNGHSAVRIDVPFLQVGSRKRVYISPQSTWTAVLSTGPRELLDRITGWSDTQITGDLRQGILTSGHMSGTLYGYVVDDDGDVVNSSGIPITSLFDVMRPANDDLLEQEGMAWAA